MHIAVLFEKDDQVKNVSFQRNVSHYDGNQIRIYHDIPLNKTNAVKHVGTLIYSKNYDLFINLCQSTISRQIVRLLDKMKVAYTGAGPQFHNVSKMAIKIAASTCGVNIPDYEIVESMDEVNNDRLEELGLPLILKHDGAEHDKFGFAAENLVKNRHQLLPRAETMLKQFGTVTIEQFIDGSEYCVLLAENPNDKNQPKVFTPVQREIFDVEYTSGKSRDLVYKSENFPCFNAVLNVELAENLKEASKKIFSACNFDGYGRCDFRVDHKTGEIYFIAMKANPDVFCPDGFSSINHILNIDPIGFDGFIEMLIDGALKRKQRSRPVIKVEYNRRKGFHIAAARNIAAGEILYDDKDTVVASGKYIRDRWTEELDRLRRRWFRDYAYLVGPDLYRVWREYPDKWLPINHSCDPTAWLRYGVFMVARRDIKKGEEIAADYGTFSIIEGDDNEFVCHCDSANCRKIIRPATDYQSHEFQENYSGHMTNYIENLCQ